jgi:seryl-tRNA synthetase
MTDLSSIENKFTKSIEEIQASWSDVQKLVENIRSDANSEYDKLKVEHDDLKGKYTEAKSKIDHIEGQLAETVERLESMSKTTSKGVSAMELLDVYLVLMEQVFESGPHVRLLLMLHGDAEQYTLSDLTTASGISAIQVRQAVFELRNANVLEFNDETQVVKLKQRFL